MTQEAADSNPDSLVKKLLDETGHSNARIAFNAMREGDKVGAAKESLKLANARVAYYEQFIGMDSPHSDYAKAYREDYENAVQLRADVRDEAAEYGVYED